MSKIDWATCEPFRAWNRLEPRARKEDFEDVLRCGVHDPLWFLTRQWQFGEFKGEDAGSAIFSKLKIRTTLPGLYKSANTAEAKEEYTDDIPAEAKVESEHPVEHYGARVEAGSYFMKMLGIYFTKPVVVAGYSSPAYLAKLRQVFPLQLPTAIVPLDDHTKKVRKLRNFVDEPLSAFLESFAGRAFDGKSLYAAAKANAAAATSSLTLAAGHNTTLQKALTDYVAWYEKTYKPKHNTSGKGAWLNEQMEYQFRMAFPEGGTANTVLLAEEYASGDLEWYSFDVDKTLKDTDELKTTPLPAAKLKSEVISVIPTIAKYAGMPHPRWWQFEDGDVDLTKIDADTTDISKLIVSEYTLIYSNDWLVVPYSLPAGSLTEVQGIVVTDVFGERSFIAPAVQGQTGDWNSWGMFNLTVRKPLAQLEGGTPVPTDTRLFLPPCVAKVSESEPVEEVLFVRDEMANLVWAIETKIPSGAGGYMDGQTFVTHLKNAIEKIEPPVGAMPIDGSAMFKYTLENTVPENWIPFVPVHLPDNKQRGIRLQRASMPRWFMNEYAAVRPNTRLLRVGVNDADGITAAFFVNEEEVPRTGCRIKSTHQRTRWYDGKVVNWLGKRKNTGRGEGSSGLQFDDLQAVKKPAKN